MRLAIVPTSLNAKIIRGKKANFGTEDLVYNIPAGILGVFHPKSDPQMTIFLTPFCRSTPAFFEGFNATILAYGQTGSGKTYTMGSASSLRCA